MKIKHILLLSAFLIILSGCTDTSDIKDNFCGVHLNYQYCKCAFHGAFCSNIGMSRGEAKDYVYQKYDAWKHYDPQKLQEDCAAKNGFVTGKTCVVCKPDEIAKNRRCVPKNDNLEEEVIETEEEQEEDNGTCKFDSDCENICEGNIMWKQGCNPRKNECVKTFDTDCSQDIETFANLSFPKICESGACIRDEKTIQAKLSELKNEQKQVSDEVKDLNATRADLNIAMLDANKNCLNGLADMTNVAIMEFATRVSSIMTGGLPSLADASVDYASDSLNKLYGYLGNNVPPEEQKLKPHEYIKLNCDLYHYFIGLQEKSSKELDSLLKKANALEDQINELEALN